MFYLLPEDELGHLLTVPPETVKQVDYGNHKIQAGASKTWVLMVLPRDYFRYYILNKRIETLLVDLIVQTTLTYEDMEEVKLQFEVKVPGTCHRVLLDMKKNGYQKTSTQRTSIFKTTDSYDNSTTKGKSPQCSNKLNPHNTSIQGILR